MKLKRTAQGCLALLVAAAFTACGGPSSSGDTGSTSAGGGGNARADAGTARFHVDVASGQVSVTALGGTASRAVLTGSAVTLNSSQLLDDPGQTGLRVLNVSLANHWGLPIGQTPSGAPSAVRVVFGSFSNIDSTTLDRRGETTVSTVTPSYGGDPAWANLYAVACAPNGAVYVSDAGGNRLRRISDGTSNTVIVAGDGTAGSVDGIGSGARFNQPRGVVVDGTSNTIFIAEGGGNRVRAMTPDGSVRTIAGTGAAGGANGTGAVCTFNSPYGIAVDAAGTVYVSEALGHRVRRLRFQGGDRGNAANWLVDTYAGSGVPGAADGQGTAARFNQPFGISCDPNGNLYVADHNNNNVRVITGDGSVRSIVSSITAGSVNGTGDVARLSLPWSVTWTGAGLVVSDAGNSSLRLISRSAGADPANPRSWTVRSLAGTGSLGSANGSGTACSFRNPSMGSLSPSGVFYLADYSNSAVRTVSIADGFGGEVLASDFRAVVAEPVTLKNATGTRPVTDGTTQPYIDYPGPIAAGATSPAQMWAFSVPAGVTSFEFTVTVEADTTVATSPESVSNPSGGPGSRDVHVSTVAGSVGTVSELVPGVAGEARFYNVYTVAADQQGNSYVVDNIADAVLRVDPGGRVTIVAGNNGNGTADGAGNVASFNNLAGIAVNPEGTAIYVAEFSVHTVRRIGLTGADPAVASNWTVSTIAGAASVSGSANGTGDTARLNGPYGVCLSPSGLLYVSEYQGERIRRLRLVGATASLAANWQVSRLAGDNSAATGAAGHVDGNAATARFDHPAGVACNSDGVVYVADSSNNCIRSVDAGGQVTTFSGPTSGSASGFVDGPAASARFNQPFGVAVGSDGYVYVADHNNNVVRMVSPTGQASTAVGDGVSAYEDGPGNTASFKSIYHLAIDRAGNVLVGDSQLLRKLQRVIRGS